MSINSLAKTPELDNKINTLKNKLSTDSINSMISNSNWKTLDKEVLQLRKELEKDSNPLKRATFAQYLINRNAYKTAKETEKDSLKDLKDGENIFPTTFNFSLLVKRKITEATIKLANYLLNRKSLSEEEKNRLKENFNV